MSQRVSGERGDVDQILGGGEQFRRRRVHLGSGCAVASSTAAAARGPTAAASKKTSSVGLSEDSRTTTAAVRSRHVHSAASTDPSMADSADRSACTVARRSELGESSLACRRIARRAAVSTSRVPHADAAATAATCASTSLDATPRARIAQQQRRTTKRDEHHLRRVAARGVRFRPTRHVRDPIGIRVASRDGRSGRFRKRQRRRDGGRERGGASPRLRRRRRRRAVVGSRTFGIVRVLARAERPRHETKRHDARVDAPRALNLSRFTPRAFARGAQHLPGDVHRRRGVHSRRAAIARSVRPQSCGGGPFVPPTETARARTRGRRARRARRRRRRRGVPSRGRHRPRLRLARRARLRARRRGTPTPLFALLLVRLQPREERSAHGGVERQFLLGAFPAASALKRGDGLEQGGVLGGGVSLCDHDDADVDHVVRAGGAPRTRRRLRRAPTSGGWW